MGFMSRLFPPKVEPFTLRWDRVAASELAATPGLMAGLLDGSIDGVTITDVIQPEEIHRALDYFRSMDPAPQIARPFGWLLGMPIGMISNEEPDRSRYLDDAERVRPLYREAFGFDPHDRVAEVLAPISGGQPLIAASEAGREYNAGQVRWWEPDHGGLPAHVGNEFRRQLEHGAMSHLVTTTQVTNHLSYFFVLQKAQLGGALSVYDLVWDDNRGRDDWNNEMPDDSWIGSVRVKQFDLAPGEMVVFGGGWRWHRVDPPDGDVARVTYGGFLAPSVDGSAIHFWS